MPNGALTFDRRQLRGDPGEVVEAEGLFEDQPIQRRPPPANAADQFGQTGTYDPHPLTERKVRDQRC